MRAGRRVCEASAAFAGVIIIASQAARHGVLEDADRAAFAAIRSRRRPAGIVAARCIAFALDRWRPGDGAALRRMDLDPGTARFFGYTVGFLTAGFQKGMAGHAARIGDDRTTGNT